MRPLPRWLPASAAVALVLFVVGYYVGSRSPERAGASAAASPTAAADAVSHVPAAKPAAASGTYPEGAAAIDPALLDPPAYATDAAPQPLPDAAHGPAGGEAATEDADTQDDADEPVHGVRLALVIDDLGRSLEDLEALRGLGVPLSYAVLPFESRTAEVVATLRLRRAEILCHLPMEPAGEADPGPGALRLDMSERDLVAGLHRALAAVPGATGVNNHMGSRLTADREVMSTVLRELSREGLFFLDSRTIPGSVGYQLAQSLGVPTAERQVFLDPDPTPEAIRGQFRLLLETARDRGAAIAIGHPYPTTLEVLRQEVARARELGYEFVPVSYLLDSDGAAL